MASREHNQLILWRTPRSGEKVDEGCVEGGNDAILSRRRNTNNGMYATKVDPNVMLSSLARSERTRGSRIARIAVRISFVLPISFVRHFSGSRAAERTR